MGVAALFLGIWLLPATVTASVLPNLEENLEEPLCRTYTQNELLYLDCSDRGLTELPEKLDYDAQALLLSNNNFVSFPAQLENFHRIEILDMSGNRLRAPLPNYMTKWSNLHTLNLSNNNYDKWLGNDNEYDIKRLDLSKNKINSIDVKAFNKIKNLSFLDLSENRIYDLPTSVFSDANNLDTLILSRNYFSEVPSFRSQSLRSLSLSYCQIANIDTEALTGMSSLLAIDLSMNEIEKIPDGIVSSTLQEIDLSYNVISVITDDTFSALPHLAVLDLRGNEFKEVWSSSHFASNPFLREVHVKGNRWSCEGFSVNLLLTYEFLTKEPAKVGDVASLICYSPSNVTQLSWQQAYILTWRPNEISKQSYTAVAVFIGVIIGIVVTSCFCRGIMSINKHTTRQTTETTTVNGPSIVTQPRVESVVMRIPLGDDLPPSYDEALLMPRLNSSFHSLPDFIDEDDNLVRNHRRSRSIGDLTESRPRPMDRRSIRRTVEISSYDRKICGMVLLQYLLLLVLVANAEISDVDGGDGNDVCYVCSCSADKNIVDCSKRSLASVPDSISDMVTSLNMSNNKLLEFPQNINRLYKLISLDLSNNQIYSLKADALDNLTSLELLNLSQNNFDSWLNLNPNEVLQPATNLKILDLSNNKFSTMENLANQELLISPSLETLILDNCRITSISGRSPLSGLINIRVFKINSNPLSRIQGLVSPTLKSFYASNCQLNSINYSELSYLPSLVYLKLSNNNGLVLSTLSNTIISGSLRYLDISYCNIMHINLAGFPNIRKVLISHNVIRFLESNNFINNSKLEYLDLSYNSIGSLRSDTFRGLSMLKYLDLSWNEIASVPEDGLLEMPSLTQLRLRRNYLTRVGHIRSTSVAILDMSYCEINTIGKDSLEGWQSLIDIDLSHNLLSHIPESLSSNTLKYLNLNYNRINTITNYTFFMLPRLTGMGLIGNRFTTIWSRSYFQSNPYLERLDLSDNMWRCECADGNMFDFYEFLTLEPNKKEESYNLICNSPVNLVGQTWLEACYFTWNPSEKKANTDSLIWFIVVMIVGLALCLVLVNGIRRTMNRRLAGIQAERVRQVEEARDRLRQLRIRAEQEALCNTPDPRDLVAPPTYDEALSMPKLNISCQSLCEVGTGQRKKRKGRRKTKSSGDLLEETERNGNLSIGDELESSEATASSTRRRRRRRPRNFGSHEITELDQSPGIRRRRMSEYGMVGASDSVTVEVEAELSRPLQIRNRRYSIDDDEPRESDF
ncbi:protein artichoke [Battus philenor]|uniref:protein artichoke n=1 Tax=Battus philenor TaxID=42288 RepID=UPI0035CF9B38